MRLHLILIPFLFLLSGCLATSGDLREVAELIDQKNAGQITEEQLAEAIEAKADEIEARAEGLANSLPTTPTGWIALLMQMGVTAAAGGVGVNQYRNAARAKRGEPVGKPIAVPNPPA